MLKDIESQENHLLLGNGFNNSLCIYTGYKNIFERMQADCQDYKKIDIKKHDYDVEKVITALKEDIVNSKNEIFLDRFIENKIKFDFMKSAYAIVKENIKNIYQEKEQGVYILLKNFTNYFTLNYDPLLYLLLMNFKREEKSIGFSNTSLFVQQDLNENQNQIYDKIKVAYNTGKLEIHTDDNNITKYLNKLTKSDFVSETKKLFENEKWSKSDIDKACDVLWKDMSQTPNDLTAQDGFSFDNYSPEKPFTQNIFFLHGAFHIYQGKNCIKKITKKQDKALYNQLEEVINDEETDIICILKGTSQEKEQEIQNNKYLQGGFNKLSSISGNIVIFGSSLDDNDSHILNAVNGSNVIKIYISSSEKRKNETYNKAKKYFVNKEIILFDYETVSYEK